MKYVNDRSVIRAPYLHSYFNFSSWLEEPIYGHINSFLISCLFTIFSVNKLKQETEVMINIPDSDKAPSNVIRIEGNKEGVRRAKSVSIYLPW